MTAEQYQTLTAIKMQESTPDACWLAFRDRAMLFLSYSTGSHGDELCRTLFAEMDVKGLEGLGIGPDGQRGANVSICVHSLKGVTARSFHDKHFGAGETPLPMNLES